MSVAWIGVAVSAGSAIYGGVQSNKANKANASNSREYIKAVQKNEKEARKLFDGFMEGYLSSKERLEGLTIQEYTQRMVETLNDPYLTQAYRSARNADWDQAQQFAEEASSQNASIFNKIVDEVGGGNYKELLKKRDESILGEDIESLYAEARRLQAPRQTAGSVRRTEGGEVIGGQRGDKFEFDISTTAIKEQNDRMFQKSRTAIEDDRIAAARQQDRAIQFLPMLDYTSFANASVVQPFNAQSLQAQLTMLQTEASLANNAMGLAFGKPLPPTQIDTSRSDALTMQSTQAALGGLADIYQRNQSTYVNQSGQRVPRTYASDGTEVRRAGTVY